MLVTGSIAFIMSFFEIVKFAVETLLALGSVSVAIIAYCQGKKNNDRHNELIEKINSKDHEISENLKCEMLELITVLISIDTKASIKTENGMMKDYSHEIEKLERLQSQPGFLLLLKSINDTGSHYYIEEELKRLTILSLNDNDIRKSIHRVLEVIKRQTNLDGAIKEIDENYRKNWNKKVKELCVMDGIYNEYFVPIIKTAIKESFVLNLIKKGSITDDSELMQFNNDEFKNNNPYNRILLCCEESANDAKIEKCVSHHFDEYTAFFDELFDGFITFLIGEKHIADNDIIKYYKMTKPEYDNFIDTYSDKITIFVKYRDEFYEYTKHQRIMKFEESI